MKESMEKFIELVKTDESVQKKLQAAADSYKGEQTEEAVFANLIAPLAEEYGFKFSYDEFQQAREQKIKEYSPDEMEQIAGGRLGDGGVGVGITFCMSNNLGFGAGGGVGGSGFGICAIVGYGEGNVECVFFGFSGN